MSKRNRKRTKRKNRVFAGESPQVLVMPAGESAWAVADREYFATHPSERWYTRAPFRGELRALSVISAAHKVRSDEMQRLAETLPGDANYRVLVIQVRPGMRHRMPYLARGNVETDTIVMLDPVTGIARTTLAALAEEFVAMYADAPQMHEPIAHDTCQTCGKDYATGDIVMLFAELPVSREYCERCGSIKRQRGEDPIAVAVHVSRADFARTDEDLQRLIARAKQHIADIGLYIVDNTDTNN